MANKKDQWISGNEAAKLLSELSGHFVDPSYIRTLSREGKIRSRSIDRRTKEYLKADVEARRVKAKKTPEQDEGSKEPESLAIAI